MNKTKATHARAIEDQITKDFIYPLHRSYHQQVAEQVPTSNEQSYVLHLPAAIVITTPATPCTLQETGSTQH